MHKVIYFMAVAGMGFPGGTEGGANDVLLLQSGDGIMLQDGTSHIRLQ